MCERLREVLMTVCVCKRRKKMIGIMDGKYRHMDKSLDTYRALIYRKKSYVHAHYEPEERKKQRLIVMWNMIFFQQSALCSFALFM